MGKITIYYTDDDYDDLELFEEAVEPVSNTVNLRIFDSGNKLLEALDGQTARPDIIFLDLNMPVKNGYDVLEDMRLKKLSIPVIIYSTANSEADKARCFAFGASYFITKPILMQDITKCVEYVLSINWKDFVRDPDNFVYGRS